MNKIKNVKIGDTIKVNGKRYLVLAVYPYHITVKEINPNNLVDKYDSFNYGDLVMNGLEDSGVKEISMDDMIQRYGEIVIAS